MGAKGFFASLFRRRRKSDFEPTLAFALRSVLRSGLLRTGAGAGSILCESLDLDPLLQEIHQSGPGWMTVFHRDTDVPELIILTPEAFGNLERTVALWDNAASFLSVVPAGGLACHRYYRRYGPTEADELIWRLSGCRAYRLQPEGMPGVFACVQESTAVAFEQVLAEDRTQQDALRDHLLATEPNEEKVGVPQTLRLLAPRELAIVDLFLPARVPCGSRTLESLAESLSAPPDLAALDRVAGVWAGSTFESNGRRFALHYFFSSSDPARAGAMREACKAVSACILRASLARLGNALGCPVQNPTLGLDARPSPAAPSRYIELSLRIRLGESGSALHVLFDASLIPALAGRAKDRAAVAATAKGASAIIPLALGLVGPLTSGRISTFSRAFIDPQLGPEHFPFGLFAELVTERDLSLLLQNQMQRIVGGRSLKRLYAWAQESSDTAGRKVVRSVVPHLFDEERLLRHLPQQARDSWKRCGARQLGSRADYLRETERAFMAIDQATRKGDLLLSPRARWLLATCVMPPLRTQARARLKALTDSGQPFALLRTLRRAQLQQLLANQPSRVVCLGLLEAQEHESLVSANISSRRWRALQQDLTHARKQLEEGLLGADEVLEAKNQIQAAALALLESSKPQPQR